MDFLANKFGKIGPFKISIPYKGMAILTGVNNLGKSTLFDFIEKTLSILSLPSIRTPRLEIIKKYFGQDSQKLPFLINKFEIINDQKSTLISLNLLNGIYCIHSGELTTNLTTNGHLGSINIGASKKICLFKNPENNLHPISQLQFINKLFDLMETSPNLEYTLLTTNSPYFFQALNRKSLTQKSYPKFNFYNFEKALPNDVDQSVKITDASENLDSVYRTLLKPIFAIMNPK